MISPPIQLAPDATQLSVSPQKMTRRPSDILQHTSQRSKPAAKRIPLSALTTLQPPNAEAQLLPDGGRGSPMKPVSSSAYYAPPPTFTADDIHQHITSTKQSESNKQTMQLATPKTSPAQPDLSLESPPLDLDATDVSDMDLPPDDGSKPAYSYATLIGMAILRAPDKKLTLSAIYNWISSTFSYYSYPEIGWQNSIRHNLSLNKAFVKVERPKDEPGKGHYWTVEAGCEGQFFRTRVAKKVSQSNKLSTTTKKDTRKRHVEFEDLPKMKKIMISPTESNLQYPANDALASPPLTEVKRRKNSLWEYDESGYFSPTADSSFEQFFDVATSRSEVFSREFSYSANALDLVLSPPPSSSPMRQDKAGLFLPRTPAVPAKQAVMASPGTSLREHRQQMTQMLTSPENLSYETVDDDPWLTATPKLKEHAVNMLDSPWDDVAERAAFGSPDKRESRRRESRRSLVCGLHAQELYETGFESSNMPGVNVLDIMRRELDRVKRYDTNPAARPSMMERSQSSLF